MGAEYNSWFAHFWKCPESDRGTLGPRPPCPILMPQSVDRSEMLPFSVADFDQYLKWVQDDVYEEMRAKLVKGRAVMFQVFTDSEGAGACALKLGSDEAGPAP